MFLKVSNKSETYKKLLAIRKKKNIARMAANKLGQEVGAKDVYSRRGGKIVFGGIDAFDFGYDKHPDELLWMRPERHKYPNLFYPRSGNTKAGRMNKDLLEKIKNLPVVTLSEYQEAIGLKTHTISVNGFIWVDGYNFWIYKEYALIELLRGAIYKPIPDMEELTETQFNELKKKAK